MVRDRLGRGDLTSRWSSLSVSGNLSLPGARATEGECPDSKSPATVSLVTLRAAHTGASRPRARSLLHSPSRPARLHGRLSSEKRL